MPYLTVRSGSEERRIAYAVGQSVRHVLDRAGIRVRSGCRGMGACGLCLVKVEAGDAGRLSDNEQIQLDASRIADGVRLACQVVPDGDLTIRIMAPAPGSHWRPLEPEEDAGNGKQPPKRPVLSKEMIEAVKTPYGIAVDVGTTHLRMSVKDLFTGERLTGRYGPNPQIIFGADIMTRLERAVSSPDDAADMKGMITDAIEEGLWDMATRDGIDMQAIVTGVVVGNTAMLALLTGMHYDRLLHTDYGSRPIDCVPDGVSHDLAQLWGVHPKADITVIPPLAGFVGSDLPAGILATRLMDSRDPSLFIDFGTNSEIALWDGNVLWVTSAAGGPAFEGSGISCGMPAEPGAVYRVRHDTGRFRAAVIDDADPKGICGSGLVDLMAVLLQRGSLSEIGRLDEKAPGDGISIIQGRPGLRVQKRDVDLFQRAKAAIGAGVKILCLQAAIRAGDLKRICVAGALGRFLDVDNAQQVGLLPVIDHDRIELCGNTALAGCEMALVDADFTNRLNRLMEKTTFINLSQYRDFNDLFMEHLYLRPFADGNDR